MKQSRRSFRKQRRQATVWAWSCSWIPFASSWWKTWDQKISWTWLRKSDLKWIVRDLSSQPKCRHRIPTQRETGYIQHKYNRPFPNFWEEVRKRESYYSKWRSCTEGAQARTLQGSTIAPLATMSDVWIPWLGNVINEREITTFSGTLAFSETTC